MGILFTHTFKEPGMWRAWLKNGQAIEISWGKRGWDFGAGVHVHSNDEDQGDRMIFLKLWRLTAVLPLGIIRREFFCGDEPQWSAYASSEFGLTFYWGLRRKQFDWPWWPHTLRYEQQMHDGSWVSVFDRDAEPYKEKYAYTYVLRSGDVQERYATISKRRHVLCSTAFKRLGWPIWIKESIDVEFSDEVGERTGSWKGGTIGCGYNLRPGETMEQALRRMEAERKF
jgi:hypothetical protein